MSENISKWKEDLNSQPKLYRLFKCDCNAENYINI